MATDEIGSWGRKFAAPQSVSVARVDFDIATANIATGIPLVRIPKGCQIVACWVVVKEVFNAVTTNVIVVGYGASLNELCAAGSVDESQLGATDVAAGKLLTFTESKDIYVKFTQTGTAATTGKATVVLMWVN